ncbi:MAG TPA: hypothetical protein VEK84_17960 [Terriglobales bacterium]|nr:hypothetical protein [Terriglobales bacterium]
MNSSITGALRKSEAGVGKTVEVLLSRLIDYAGLFPPAGLDMLSAVTNYDGYLRSEYRWMLGRFIVLVSRLSELEEALGRLPMADSKPWCLSVLLSADPNADVARIVEFNARTSGPGNGRSAVVESVEVKAESPADVERMAGNIPRELAAYFEIPLTGRERECVAAVAKCGRRAKLRTGGETADRFPDSARVVEFVRLCALAGVPFKATAGLHHPIRSVHRLTYQPDSPSGMMHGFLNVFLAAAFVKAGMGTPLALELLEEQSAAAMQFDSEGVEWREHRLSRPEVAAARQDFSISFGSCSFTEPVDDLRSLGLL